MYNIVLLHVRNSYGCIASHTVVAVAGGAILIANQDVDVCVDANESELQIHSYVKAAQTVLSVPLPFPAIHNRYRSKRR